MFRLNVFPVRIPPLRERRDDIPLLIEFFPGKFGQLHGRHVTGLTDQAMAALLDHDYPGNIRELENMIERAVILSSDHGALDIGHLFTHEGAIRPRAIGIDTAGRCNPAHATADTVTSCLASLVERAVDERTTFEGLENMLIRTAVSKAGGNLSLAARMLGMSRSQLAYRYNKL